MYTILHNIVSGGTNFETNYRNMEKVQESIGSLMSLIIEEKYGSRCFKSQFRSNKKILSFQQLVPTFNQYYVFCLVCFDPHFKQVTVKVI